MDGDLRTREALLMFMNKLHNIYLLYVIFCKICKLLQNDNKKKNEVIKTIVNLLE